MNSKIIITYSDLFKEKIEKDKIISLVTKMDQVHLGHLIYMLQNRDRLKEGFMSSYLKLLLIEKNEVPEDFQLSKECIQFILDNELITIQGLLYLLKYIYSFASIKECAITYENFELSEKIIYEVINVQLMLCDHMQIDISDEDLLFFNMIKFNMKSNIKSLISRTWYVYSVLSRKEDLYKDKNTKYVDFNKLYMEYNGYSIETFLAVYFYLYSCFENKENISPFINIQDYFEASAISAICTKIVRNSLSSFDEFKSYSENTLSNSWDYEIFTEKPLAKSTDKYMILPSDIHLEALLFNNFRNVIQSLYGSKDNDFKQFFGHPFEEYVKELCDSVVISSLKGIKEFPIKGNSMSSEYYFINRDKMIAIEVKSKDLDRKKLFCNNDTKLIQGVIKEQFVKPIIQIDKSLSLMNTSKHKSILEGIKLIFALAVTFENTYLGVPKYHDYAVSKIVSDVDYKGNITYFFNFSIEEFECIVWMFENGYDVFELLTRYYEHSRTTMLYNYLASNNIHYNVVPKLVDSIFDESMKKFRIILGEKNVRDSPS